MQIILLERVEKLGKLGDIVTVKPGYARNYLLPTGRALRANKENLEKFEAERTEREARNADAKTAAQSEAANDGLASLLLLRLRHQSRDDELRLREVRQVLHLADRELVQHPRLFGIRGPAELRLARPLRRATW